jgi:hypothetical protein
MKPFRKLKRIDFEQSPIWEWSMEEEAEVSDQAADARDESFVRPTDHTEVPMADFAQFIVAASYELKDGSRFPGAVEVTVAQGQVACQPLFVFMIDRQLQVPGVETNRLLTRYTKAIDNYPIKWQLAVNIQGESAVRAENISGGDMKDMVRAGINALLSLRK